MMSIKKIIYLYLLLVTTNLVIAQQKLLHPYTNKQAHVRIGKALSREENNYLAKRMPRTKKVLETMLSTKLNDHQIPRIALCASGGGYRAMLATLGSLKGAQHPYNHRSFSTLLHLLSSSTVQKIIATLARYITAWFGSASASHPLPLPADTHTTTLLDATTYCAALSGSTWAVAGWIQSQQPLPTFAQKTIDNITLHVVENVSIKNLVLALSKKYSSDQYISLVDVYGVMLADTLLKDCGAANPNDCTLAMQQDYVATGMIPFPLYTAILGDDTQNYEWVEFNPFEISCPYLNAHIPSWAFGRTFAASASQDYVAPQSLGYCMGIWGSGMCLNGKEFIELLKPYVGDALDDYFDDATTNDLTDKIEDILEHLIGSIGKQQDDSLLGRRLSPARVPNWTYKTPNAPLSTQECLTLVDAGIDFRIPMPPLLQQERNVNIIIILDAADSPVGTELRLAQAYAYKHGLKFPHINYETIMHPCSVHKDPQNPTVPVVIYMPLIKNEKYMNGWDPRTAEFVHYADFKYTKEESELLMGLTEFTMMENMPIIVDEIRQWILAHP